MVLSEIGINIAPLLAGAGIIGVAIGFGSQKLVQDLITGIFLLLENAMQVGDYVTVSGLSGTVEKLSVRTIRLRAGDGSVHIIPFSSVTTVTNVNRGLGNASVSVVVDYDEDTDRVAACCRDRRRHARRARLRRQDAERPAALGRRQGGRRRGDDRGPSGLHRFRPVVRAARIQPTHEAAVPGAWHPALQPDAQHRRHAAAGRHVAGNRCPTTAGPDAGGANEAGPDTSGPKTAGAKTVGSDTVGPHTAGLPIPPAPIPPAPIPPAPIPPARTRRMSDLEPLTDTIREAGFAFVHGGRDAGGAAGRTGSLADWQAFAASWDDLGLDTYMADGGRYRKRRFAVFGARGRRVRSAASRTSRITRAATTTR